MINRPFDAIVAADIQSLIDAARPEGRQLEYKSIAPGNTDADKKEFLADVTSFANTAGGDLLIGVDERREEGRAMGIAAALSPIVAANADAEIRRLENILRDGVAPRMAGVRVRPIAVEGGVVLLFRVPKSWVGLHQVTYQNVARFYARNNAGKYQMDVHEIGQAFRSSIDVGERITRLHKDRVARIAGRLSEVRLRPGATAIMHVIPIPSFEGATVLDMGQIEQEMERLRPIYVRHQYGGRFNIDGYLFNGPQRDDGQLTSYTQVSRNGVVETATASLLDAHENYLPIVTIEDEIIGTARRYLAACESLDLGLPVSINLALAGVNGKQIPLGPRVLPILDPPSIDRDVLYLPNVVVEEYGTDADRIVRPILDALWQAAGYRASLNYNAEGNWQRRI